VLVDALHREAVYRFLLKPWDDELLRNFIRPGTPFKKLDIL
jgi:hypothetical protein